MASAMPSRLAVIIIFLICQFAGATSKPHTVSFGKTITVPWTTGAAEKILSLKLRPLLVDERVKEFSLSPAHEITDRLFVMRRAFRLNDSLPQESGAAPRWQWQRGGWLLIDRVTGRISPLNLADFDTIYSAASWYRDYAAYCGVSEDGKIFAVVVQVGRRKPVLKKPLDAPPLAENAAPDSACPTPTWQRAPMRVTFGPLGDTKQTFAIRGHIVDIMTEEEDEETTKEEIKK